LGILIKGVKLMTGHKKATFYSHLFKFTLASLLIFTVATSADAVPVTLEFDDVSIFGGTLTYGGGGAPLVGSDIIFDQITGIGTPLNAGPAGALSVVGADLDFTTGASLGGDPTGHLWSGGGSFVLTAADVLDPNSASIFGVAGPHVLLTGSFTGTLFTPSVSFFAGNLSFSGLGTDQKNPALEDYFGVFGVDWAFANTEISAGTAATDVTLPFSASVTDADLVNTGDFIPEPATCFLAVVGLLACTSLRRRS
jgi:hypothetical protein